VLLHGSLDPLLSSDGGSLSLVLVRSEPSLESERLSLGRLELSSLLSLGRFDPELDGSLSDGGWLPLYDEPRLGSSLWLGRSLSDVEFESLVERDVLREPDVLRESDPLWESDVDWLGDPDCDWQDDPESLPDRESLIE